MSPMSFAGINGERADVILGRLGFEAGDGLTIDTLAHYFRLVHPELLSAHDHASCIGRVLRELERRGAVTRIRGNSTNPDVWSLASGRTPR